MFGRKKRAKPALGRAKDAPAAGRGAQRRAARELRERRSGIRVSMSDRNAGRQDRTPLIDFVGFKHDDPSSAMNPADANKAYGISAEDRVHMAIFGLPGAGKSSILSLLMYQNIMRGDGFMLLDPHGKLARDVMGMIPEERHNDVIYVNPASLYRYKRTVKINPLEVNSEAERYVVVMSFVSALYNLYKDTWGPRLEVVLRNAANALVESDGKNRLGNISAMVTDETERKAILEDVKSHNVRHFWEEIFQKQYSKDAGSAAYNKIDKILATPTVAAMFDTAKSSISIRDIMENRRIFIVDISTGTSDDIAEFLGSIFLNMLYVDAKKRLDLEGEQALRNRFYVYVDEAHMFSNSTMSEMLRSLRKFGIKITLATQTCNAFDGSFSKEIPGVCKTVITGRCDSNTAAMLKPIMPASVDMMQRLPAHTFMMFSDEAGVQANATFRSRHMPLPGSIHCDWQMLAKKSLERWGETVAPDKYMPNNHDRLLFTPVEACIIHMMFFDPRDWYRDEFMNRVPLVFPRTVQRVISNALDRLATDGYLAIRYPGHDDGDEKVRKRYVLGEKSTRMYLSRAYGGRRAGSEIHMETIFRIAGNNMNKHRYCFPDLGDRPAGRRKASSNADLPDLLIVEPEVIEQDGAPAYDPLKWSEKNRLAVEVETDPTKHMAHSVYNYTKNMERGRGVWFVCFNDRHRNALETAIRKRHPDLKRCKMDVVLPEIMMQRKAESGGADPSDDAYYVAEFPDTYDEFFSPVKAMTIRQIMEAAGHGGRIPGTGDVVARQEHRSAATVRHARRRTVRAPEGRGILGFIDGLGADHHDGRPAYVEPGRTRDARFETDLEWYIYLGFQKQEIFSCDLDIIRKHVGNQYGETAISEAIKSLVAAGIMRKVPYGVEKITDTLDGTGRKRTKRKQMVLEPVYDKTEQAGLRDAARQDAAGPGMISGPDMLAGLETKSTSELRHMLNHDTLTDTQERLLRTEIKRRRDMPDAAP